MSPGGQLIADWLKTKPGLIVADTENSVLELAYARSPFPKKAIPFEEFKETLARVGYHPSGRVRGDTHATYWVLSLPE